MKTFKGKMAYNREAMILGHTLLRMYKTNQDKAQMFRHSSTLLQLDAEILNVVPRKGAWWR